MISRSKWLLTHSLFVTVPVIIFLVLAITIMGSNTLIGRDIFFVSPQLPTLSPESRRLEIETNQQINRPMQAVYHVEALAERVGWTPELYQQAGLLWAAVGDEEQALSYWELASQTSSDPLLLKAVADIYLQQRHWTQAIDTLNSLIEQQSDNTWANYYLGLILAPFDPLRAQLYLQQAAVDPLYNESARAIRVVLLENRGDDSLDNLNIPMQVGLKMIEYELWSYAALTFDHANSLAIAGTGQPLTEALGYLGLALDRMGEDGSYAIFEAVRLNPNDPQIRFLQALHYRHLGQYDASLNTMIQAVALAPENAALYAELSTAYRLTRQLEEAERWLKTAVSLSNNAGQYQQLLALFYAEEAYNLGSDGLTALETTLDVMPNDPDLLASMGWALHQLGDSTTGLNEIDRALEISPDNTRALYYKASILLDTDGDRALAQRLLERASQNDSPIASDALRVLSSLE